MSTRSLRRTDSPDEANLRKCIREIPNWPKQGVSFKDISPLLNNPSTLAMAVEMMVNPFRGKGVDLVVGAESRGFIFGTAVAQALSAGFVPVRKPGKLPWHVYSMSYDLEYGTDTLQIHRDAIKEGQKVLLADDLLATGGTMEACIRLVRQFDCQVVGMTVLIELEALGGRRRLEPFVGKMHSVVQY